MPGPRSPRSGGDGARCSSSSMPSPRSSGSAAASTRRASAGRSMTGRLAWVATTRRTLASCATPSLAEHRDSPLPSPQGRELTLLLLDEHQGVAFWVVDDRERGSPRDLEALLHDGPAEGR